MTAPDLLTARAEVHPEKWAVIEDRDGDVTKWSYRELNRRAKNPRNSTRFIMTAVPAMAAALLLVMGLALYASWPSNEAGARQAVGMVTLADGSVYATESEGSPRRPVALQSFVRPGERYETGAGAAFAFGLAGPSEIRVAPDSRLKVGDARALSLEKGLIWLDVAEGDRHFRVETPAGNVTVFGTTFSVEVADGHTVVTLEDGEVNVENNVDFTVLHPDRQVTAGPNTRPLVPVTVDATALMAWADEFKPDDKAERLFLATIKTSDVKELRAEQIWRLDTRGKVVPRAITFEWNPDVYRVGHASYDVYVYDENMKPLFSSRIDGSEFGDKSHDHYTVRVPSHESLGEKTVFIKLVPDESTGSIETTFTEVSVVGM